MHDKKTKLMIEDNTIYEIDLECLRAKEERRKRNGLKAGGKRAGTSRIQRTK